MQNNIHKEIKKGLKSYLTGKKLFNDDKSTSYKYFQQSLKYLFKCKEDANISERYGKLINDTETECYKYLNSTIDTIDITPTSATDIEPNIFKLIEEGNIKEILNIDRREIDFNVYNSEGLSPLHVCIKNGDLRLLKFFFKLNGSIDQVNKNGNTLLEYACLQHDPNTIAFLLFHGANMKKHLYFREGTAKNLLKKSDIDIANIIKMVVIYYQEDTDISNNLKFIFNFINKNERIGFNDLTVQYLLNGLSNCLKKMNPEQSNTYIEIIKDELTHPLKKKLSCP